MTFNKVEDDVIKVLQENKDTKSDDMILYRDYVAYKLGAYERNTTTNWLERVLIDNRYRISYGIAPYGTVSRVRRKLQETYPELRPPKGARALRRLKEQEYKEYARKGVKK